MKYTVLFAGALLIGFSVPAGASHGEPGGMLPDVLGSAHVKGTYNLGNTEDDFLNHGAQIILDAGMRVIRVYMLRPWEFYPYNSDWPDSFDSLTAKAQHPYYQALFNKPFSTYLLVAYRRDVDEHYWRTGIDAGQIEKERVAFYDLTKHLLETYAGTGKTFILQHWEGDWAIRGSFDAGQELTQGEIDNMITWLDARQLGVNQARDEVGMDDVYVYHACEMNLVRNSMLYGQSNVVTHVLPNTTVDLASYSAYDTIPNAGEFSDAIDFIADRLPETAVWGRRSVYIGEYGWPENETNAGTVQGILHSTITVALMKGCPYVVYWQVFDNEAYRTPVDSNDDVRGFWLLRPDGTQSIAYDYIQERLTTYDSDFDGLLDIDEGTYDVDGDGVVNMRDTDSDGDGFADSEDPAPYDPGIPELALGAGILLLALGAAAALRMRRR